MVQYMLNDVDPGVLKTKLVNFFIYGNIISCEKQDALRERKPRRMRCRWMRST